jgi:hypothetical protein
LEVHDLDVVVGPSQENLMVLRDGLAALGARPAEIPPLRALQEVDVLSVPTAHGQVDLMLEQGRRRYAELARRSTIVVICGVGVPVANSDEAWALRQQFKDPAGCR